MPKKSVDIREFAGMIGSVDERDLVLGTAAYAKNIDMVTQSGAFIPLPDDQAKTGTISGAKSFVQFEDNAKAAYWDGSGIKVIANVSASTLSIAAPTVGGTIGTLATSGSQSGSSDGEAVHLGLGGGSTYPSVWIGKIAHGQFSGVAPTGDQIESATISSSPAESSGTLRGTPTSDINAVSFEAGTKLFYYASLVFDGFQPSPAKLISTLTFSTSDLATGQKGWPDADVVVAVAQSDTASPTGLNILSKRVTGLKLFRGTALSTSADTPDSDVEMIADIDINDSSWNSWTSGTKTGMKILVNDAGGSLLSDFSNETGYSYTLSDMDMHYGVSCVADGYHIIGDAWQTENKYRPNMIFRSKSYRFDTFDWASDYLTLPTQPNALVSFQGKVYAFGNGMTHVIDPTSFTVIDTWEGIGSVHERSVFVSDRGMLWVDSNNIYHHDGSRMNVIGAPVLRNKFLADAGWLNADVTYIPTITYSSKYDSAIIVYRTSSGAATYGLMYHFTSGQWQHLTMPVNGALADSLITTTGDPVVVINSTAYGLFGGSSFRSWQFVSNNINPTLGSRVKFYDAYLGVNAGTPGVTTLTYYDDDPLYSTAHNWGSPTVDPSNSKLYKGQINQKPGGSWDAVRDFSISLSGIASQKFTHITLIARPITPR